MRRLAILGLLVAAVSISAQDTKAPATKTKAPVQGIKAAPTGTKESAQQRAGLTIAPETRAATKTATIMREVYDYESGARRDPFASLLMTAELRPTVTDLRLVGILFDESGRRPVAVMRDILTNTQYRVTTGMTLGRLRVALIKRRAVIFNIEEFGLNRQDSLILGDTSKVRTR